MNKLSLILSLVIGIAFSGCVADNGVFLDSNGGSGTSGSVTKFAVHDNYMYVLNPNEVLTFDITNDADPIQVSSVATDYGLESIFIYEDAIYLGSTNSLYILDISTPENPTILSKTDRSETVFDGCDPVVVQENHAYSTVKVIQNICGDINSRSALVVFDVTNKRFPQEVGAYDMGQPNGLGIKESHLFVCDAEVDGIVLFDISDPEQIVRKDALTIDVLNPVDVIIDRNTLIVSAQTYFEIYNVQDINNIYKVGQVEK